MNWLQFATSGISPTNTPLPTNTALPPTSTPLPTSTPGSAGINPYGIVQAEAFSSQQSAVVVATGDTDGGQDIQLTNNGGYIAFTDVDFGTAGPSSVVIRATTDGHGINVQLRTGSPSGQVFCTVYLSGGGVYASDTNTCWPKPTNLQTVYVTVTGNVNLNWLQFVP